jgi:DNA-binding protein YbaB
MNPPSRHSSQIEKVTVEGSVEDAIVDIESTAEGRVAGIEFKSVILDYLRWLK